MANLKNITDLPVAESSKGLNLIVNDNGAAKQISANAIGNVKTVNSVEPDDNGNVNIEIPEGFSGSWNDLEDKPFDEVETVLFEGEIVFSEDRFDFDNPFKLINGKTYYVSIDDMTLPVECYYDDTDSAECLTIYQDSFIVQIYSKGYDGPCYMYSSDISGTHYLKIIEKVVLSIDKKYMEEGVRSLVGPFFGHTVTKADERNKIVRSLTPYKLSGEFVGVIMPIKFYYANTNSNPLLFIDDLEGRPVSFPSDKDATAITKGTHLFVYTNIGWEFLL